MGRKNLSEEKRELILDAFEKVILREGYAKASQRKIAEEAGMNQPMIHHYFSGGDAMLEALLERSAARYREALVDFTNASDSLASEETLRFMCSKEFHTVTRKNEAMFHIMSQAKLNDSAMTLLADIYQAWLQEMTSQLATLEVENPENLAYIMMCLIIGHDRMKILNFGEQRNELMVEALKGLLPEEV